MLQASIAVTSFAPALTAATAQASVTLKVRSQNDAIRPYIYNRTSLMQAQQHLPISTKIFHGIGSVAYGIKDNGFGTFLLIFYNQVIGLDAAIVSLALMIAMFVDALADPLIGHYSDNTYTRWGKRLPWLYLAPLPLACAWMLLWSPPAGLGNWVILYLILSAILVRVLVSSYEIPAASLIPELTKDYDERTQVMRFRYLFGWASGLITLFLAYTVFLVPDAKHAVGQLNVDGYWRLGLFGAIAMFAATLISAMGQHKRVAHYPTQKPLRLGLVHAFGEIRESLSHPAALTLMFGALMMYTSQGITFAIGNYLYLYGWQFSTAAFSFYPVILFVSVVSAFFIVAPLTKRFGKKAVAIYTGLIAMTLWIIPYSLAVINLWPQAGSNSSTMGLFLFAFLTNTLSVTVMITAQSMVADIVEASQLQTGRRSEGVFSAGWFFTQKCGTGIGIFLSGLIINLSGFPAKAVPGQVPEAIIDNLFLCYIAAVAILAIAAAFIFRKFPIGRSDHEERLRQLALVE
jgi:GPH family glycoside/pentoside/hexuronide:cation symporter